MTSAPESESKPRSVKNSCTPLWAWMFKPETFSSTSDRLTACCSLINSEDTVPTIAGVNCESTASLVPIVLDCGIAEASTLTYSARVPCPSSFFGFASASGSAQTNPPANKRATSGPQIEILLLFPDTSYSSWTSRVRGFSRLGISVCRYLEMSKATISFSSLT